MNELALFAGAGGGILGGKLLGWRTVCAVEWEPYPASVLCARQNDGLLPPFPIWDDVQPLTESRGEELLTWYLEGFRVRTSPPQAREMDLTENAAPCGLKWRGWLAKYDHSTCSWKTAQCSLLEEESESLVTLPRWGMTVDGLLWEQPTLEPNTKETECGLWPTPTTPSGGGNCGGSGAYKNALKNGTYIPHSINPNLYEWLMGWPLGWTDLKPLEMDKSLSAPPPLSES